MSSDRRLEYYDNLKEQARSVTVATFDQHIATAEFMKAAGFTWVTNEKLWRFEHLQFTEKEAIAEVKNPPVFMKRCMESFM